MLQKRANKKAAVGAAAKYILTLGGKEYTNNLTSPVYQICNEMSRK